MKRQFSIFILAFVCQLSQLTNAAVGCMDHSKHMGSDNRWHSNQLSICDTCDYKDYHYVQCNCPCDRYPRSYNRGRCSECWHFRDYSVNSYNNTKATEEDEQDLCVPE